MRAFSTNLKEESLKALSSDAWVWLFKIQASPSESIYLTNNNDNITHDDPDDSPDVGSKTYQSSVIEFSSMSQDGTGNASRAVITISNVTHEVSRAVQTHDAFFGKERTIKVMIYHTGRAESFNMGTYRCKAISVNRLVGSFQIGIDNLIGRTFPGRRFARYRCGHAYKGPFCLYDGALETCDLTIDGENGCGVHDNVHRHGGYPGIVA